MSKEESFSVLPYELLEQLEEEQRLQRGLTYEQWQGELKLLSTMGKKMFERSSTLRQVIQRKEKERSGLSCKASTTATTTTTTISSSKANPTKSKISEAHLLFLQHPDILVAESKALASSALQRSEIVLTSIRATMSYSHLQYIKRHEAEALTHDAQLVHLARELLECTVNLLTLWMQEQKDEELGKESHSVDIVSSNYDNNVEGRERKTKKQKSFDYAANIASLKELCKKYLQQEINDYFAAAQSWMSEAKENRQIRFACAKNNENNDSLFDAIIATLLGCGLLVNERNDNKNKNNGEIVYKDLHNKHLLVEQSIDKNSCESKNKEESLSPSLPVYVDTVYDHLMWLSHELEMYFNEYDMAKNYAELAALVLTSTFQESTFSFVKKQNWKSSEYETSNVCKSQTTNHAARRESVTAMQESISNVLENSNNNNKISATEILISSKYMSRYLSAMQTACWLSVRINEYSKVFIYIERQLNALMYLNTHLSSCPNCGKCNEKNESKNNNNNNSINSNMSHATLHFSKKVREQLKCEEQEEEEFLEKEYQYKCYGSIWSDETQNMQKKNNILSSIVKQYSQFICNAHVAFWTSHTSTFITLHVTLIMMLLYTLVTSETHKQELQRFANKKNESMNDGNHLQCKSESNCETVSKKKAVEELEEKEENSSHNDNNNSDNIRTIKEHCIYDKADVESVISSCLAVLSRCQYITSVIESCFHLVNSDNISSSDTSSPECIANEQKQHKQQTWPFVFNNSIYDTTFGENKELGNTKCNEGVRTTNANANTTTTWSEELNEWKQTMLLRNKQLLERQMRQQIPYCHQRQQRINAKMTKYAQYAKTHPLIATSMLLKDVIRIITTITDAIISIKTCVCSNVSTQLEVNSARLDTTTTHTLFRQLKTLLRALHSCDRTLSTLIDRLETELIRLTELQTAHEEMQNSSSCATIE